MTPQTIEVVAAVIVRDGKILICRRKPGGRHPLKWEFPGGKVEPGEDPAAALKRELREELAIDAEIGLEIAAYNVRYGNGPTIHLRFFDVNEFRGELQNLDFDQIVWAERATLLDYDFLEGDVPFVRQLSSSRSRP
ncbi:MAG: (deoxy)nucleoside triphosphate pyrophosphohydrolase [Bryobacterales bacterium]|nr:(deoxy)nucleoside triphosphate pyrophosphohydrolase [Bryobacterales bacterium]MBV9398063.1 (deoxy)nucleoside triphosphate pyrophosphohydrolase [Bryobacterales bacterium]